MTDRLTIHDARKAGFCISGARAKCEALGIDFKRFVREGFPLDEAAEINDGQVQKIVAEARKRVSDGR